MSKNENLLTEAQVRQFMKLANLEPLTPGFVHGLHEAGGTVTPGGSQGAYAKGGGKGIKRGRVHGTGPIPRSREESEDEREDRAAQAQKDAGGTIDPHSTPAAKKAAEADVISAVSPDERRRPKKPEETAVAAEKKPQKESHGRGRGEGAAGYGSPDDNGRAGARLREQLPPEEEDLAPLDMEEEPLEDEFPPEEERDLGPPEGGREVSVDDFLAALEVALEDVLGDEVEVDQEGEEDELDVEEDPLGDEEEVELGALGDEEELPLQELVNKITKRVAKRIVREALQNKPPRQQRQRRRRKK